MPCVHVQIYDEMVDELCDADGSDRLGEHNPALAHDVTLLSTLLLCALRLRRVLEANRKCLPGHRRVAHSLHTINAVPPAFAYALLA